MGSCSNRGETKEEKTSRFVQNILSTKNFDTNWQSSKGAKIRGMLGVEKGNQFIKDIKKYK